MRRMLAGVVLILVVASLGAPSGAGADPGYTPAFRLGSAPTNPVPEGEPVELFVAIDRDPNAPPDGYATGSVTFLDGLQQPAPIGTATLTRGQATFTATALEPGDHWISVDYEGDDLYLPGTSSPTKVSVTTAGGIDDSGELPRIAGEDAIETSILVSRSQFNDVDVTEFQDGEDAQSVVLARADDFSDGLAGAPLAAAMHGPLLLTPRDALRDDVVDEIQRILKPGGRSIVYLLGGDAALAPEVDDEVQDLGHETIRVTGDDRFETAVRIANEVGNPKTILLASARSFADALAGGAAAAHVGASLLLTDGEAMPYWTDRYLAAQQSPQVFALGGPAAEAAPSATPLVGADRYATAVAVADRFFQDPDTIAVASGVRFGDALSGGPQAGAFGLPLLLTPPDAVPPSVADYVARHPTVVDALLYGGEVAVGFDVEHALAELLTGRG